MTQYNEDMLKNLDKESLIDLYLGLQDQMIKTNQNMENLIEQIRIAQNHRFGRSSEKGITDGQGYLSGNGGDIVYFNEAEADSNEKEPEPTLKKVLKHRPRPKGKRDEDLKDLPVEKIRHDLSEEKLHEIFGDTWKTLPDEVYKRLRFCPSTFVVEEHHVAVYAAADEGKQENVIVKADRPKDLLRNSIATPSLVAGIMNAKYTNGTPLYRIEADFERREIHLSRATMANWMIRCSENCLSLLYDRLHRELFRYHVLQADETPVEVSKDGRSAGTKSYMWVYRTGIMHKNHPIVLYDYQKTRKADHPETFLKGFSGVLVTDGYQVYHTMENQRLRDQEENLTVAGCWSHARRRFADVVKTMTKEASKGTLAYQALDMIQAMYKLDGSFSGQPAEERLKMRQTTLRPMVEAFFAWIRMNQPDVPPKSATGKGFTYCLNQEKYLKAFLNDPEIPMDNNGAERAIRGFCIGRKNWVMIDTIHGAQASAIIYSLVETAKANDLKIYEYLEYLLTEIPQHEDDKNLDFLDDLLPWSEKLPERCRKTNI